MMIECINFGCINYANVFLATPDGGSVGLMVCQECSLTISKKLIGLENVMKLVDHDIKT